MKLKKITRTAKAVTWSIEENKKPKEAGDPAPKISSSITSNEAPLPKFDNALVDLKAVVLKWMELPASHKEKITIIGVSFTYTAGGTKSASIIYEQHLDLMAEGETIQYQTPAIRIDKPEKGETKKPMATQAQAQKVGKFFHAAVEYVKGKRSQGVLFDEGTEPEDEADADARKGQGRLSVVD